MKNHDPSLCDGKLVFLTPQDNNNMARELILLKRDEILKAHQSNIDWLNTFINRSAVRYMHDYYKKEAIAKIDKCSQ